MRVSGPEKKKPLLFLTSFPHPAQCRRGYFYKEIEMNKKFSLSVVGVASTECEISVVIPAPVIPAPLLEDGVYTLELVVAGGRRPELRLSANAAPTSKWVAEFDDWALSDSDQSLSGIPDALVGGLFYFLEAVGVALPEQGDDSEDAVVPLLLRVSTLRTKEQGD